MPPLLLITKTAIIKGFAGVSLLRHVCIITHSPIISLSVFHQEGDSLITVFLFPPSPSFSIDKSADQNLSIYPVKENVNVSSYHIKACCMSKPHVPKGAEDFRNEAVWISMAPPVAWLRSLGALLPPRHRVTLPPAISNGTQTTFHKVSSARPCCKLYMNPALKTDT